MAGCSKSKPEEKESVSRDSYEIRVNSDTAKCNGDSQKTNEMYTLLRDLELKNQPNETGGKVVNTKSTEYSGKTDFRKLYVGDEVKEYCTQNGYSFITSNSDSHIFENSGWVLESDLKQSSGDKYEGKISSYILEEKDPGYYEGEIEKFLNIKPSILELEILAAKKVIDSGKCDVAEFSMIDRLGKDINNPKFEVECKNGQKFEVYKNEILADTGTIASNAEKSIPKQEAITQCKALVISQLTQQHTANFHEILGTSYNLNSKTGNVALVMDFEAKNALGQKSSFKARCIFTPEGTKEVSIKES